MGEPMVREEGQSVKVGGAGCAYAGRPVHLIGIGGCGMRALAELLIGRGAVISGSDSVPSAALGRLTEAGARVHVGQQAENLPDQLDLVVHSAAIHESNPELLAARARGCEVLKYSQMLGRLMSDRCGVAVAGTHGKSTTTGMVAYSLVSAGKSPSYVVGATVGQLGGPSGVGEGPHFVVEACEYDRSFLNLQPTLAAILNIDDDHLDCFQDLEAIVEAFRAFAAKVPPHGVLVVNGDDREAIKAVREPACEVQTFGLSPRSRWLAANLNSRQGRYAFDVLLDGREFCRAELKLAGLHQVYNALAAAALLHHAGLTGDQIAAGLGGYEGAHRRMTLKGQPGGITVLDDYAHHPTEIQATLRAIRDQYRPRRLWCVFQPHQHSRTRFLLKDFARSFSMADEVIVPDIYFVRDSERERDHISSADLVAQIGLGGGRAVYLKEFADIVEHLSGALTPGDLVVTMGAGNIWEVADDIVRRLGTDR
ncbi:MAG TPA: UDP-N-acetylmuramate--L-alanine ligase [Phycisphaerae bacterium]|nr:UDP-N-acetylmuramate--L-alanine ligase [Phycisphaerae bacterium]